MDPETGYRYYKRGQTVQAEQIQTSSGRSEVPLDDIQRVFDAKSPRHLTRPSSNISAAWLKSASPSTQEALVTLDAITACEILPYQVKTKEVAPQPYLYVRAETSLAQIDGARERAFGVMRDHLNEHDLLPAAPGFLVAVEDDCTLEPGWRDDKPWCFTVDFCIPTHELLELPSPFKSALFPAAKVAYTLHIGPYEPLHLASRTIRTWALEEGQELGTKREVYFVGPRETSERSRFRTEVQYVIGPDKAVQE